MKLVIFGVLLVLIGHFAFSQTTISGKITDEKDVPIIGASVVISKKGANNIIAYNISDNKGSYSIRLSTLEKEVDIRVRSIGYKTILKTVPNSTIELDFILESDTVELDEILIKAPTPIEKRGDTISYNVDSFAKVQDRTIADALARMPGIEVLNNGKVLYQGKPINKYYIEGLDLLGGKYNLANRNLPHKEVTEVQILENHQPIKMLDSLVFTDRAALNIKLKNTYTFTGQAKVGTGFSPLLWDANITPMLFTKNQQMLVSYQANNIGNNVSSQLNVLTMDAILEQLENGSDQHEWLQVQQLSTPRFSERRWLDNNIHLFSGNYLQKLSKDYELRLNVSYLNDYQQQRGFTSTLFFTPTDTISLFEEKKNRFYINTLETNLTLQKNTKNSFLKNSFQFQGSSDSQWGNLITNENLLTQNLENRFYKLSNSFRTIFSLGKQLLTLNSYIGLSKSPQTLQVNPGQFEGLLNNGNSYNEVFQEVELQTLKINNSVSFTKGWKQFSFSPKIGVQLERQQLDSKISTAESLPNAFKNDLDWNRSKFFFDLKSQFKKDKWFIELKTPVNMNSYRIEDTALQENEDIERFTFEPRLALEYNANTFWRFNTSASLSNQFGAISQLHYAYILRSYRNLQRINAPLPQIFNQNFSSGISYRNPLRLLFWKVAYSYTQSKNNLLYQTQVLENGATELQAIEQDNERVSRTISIRLGKYFSKLKTNLTLNSSFGLQDFQQLLNDKTTTIENQSWSVGGKLEIDFANWFNTEYYANWYFSKNRIQNRPNATIVQQSHLLNLNFHPKERQYLALKTEYIKNNLFSENTENIFADIVYRFTLGKNNIDLELQWNNIFGTENYRTTNINSFSYIETSFQLRPRQVLCKVRFSL